MKVAKIENKSPANFGNYNDRFYLQAKYIIQLLNDSANNGTIINRNDITNCFVDFKFHEKEILVVEENDYWLNKRVRKEYNRTDFLNRYDTKLNSLQWFKSNLGSAILKGKILAIPVIEI